MDRPCANIPAPSDPIKIASKPGRIPNESIRARSAAYRAISRIDWTRRAGARIVAHQMFYNLRTFPMIRKRGSMRLVIRGVLCMLCVLMAATAHAQVQTGSVAGIATDASNAIIPGVQVSTYNVGGTQSFQQSSLSAHGSSTNDVSYNIDGATVNWPGGGGGATMMYYDQGMFEEVNYMTSAIPAEVMVGGVSINMVTKDAGNKWRGDARYNFSSGCLEQPTAPGQ